MLRNDFIIIIFPKLSGHPRNVTFIAIEQEYPILVQSTSFEEYDIKLEAIFRKIYRLGSR